MTQPPKPLFDRLPAVPTRANANAKATVPNVAREEAARKRLKARLEPIEAAELHPPGIDPRTAAVSSLMVANFVADERTPKRFTKFIESEFLDPTALEDLPIAARLVLRILSKLGPDLDERTTEVPADLLAAARALRERLIRISERFLSDFDDANGLLVTVRFGQSPADTVYDLRMLAGLCREHAERLAADAAGAYTPELEREARTMAQRLEEALIGPQSNEERDWRAYVTRSLAMLVPLYEEVCRAGRFLFHDMRPETHFPSLASVARVRRRLKRESVRRTESLPAPAMRGAASFKPPRGSIPPEVSLIGVSLEREQAVAGALEPALSPAAAPAPAPTPTAAATAAAEPVRPSRVDALEVVSLDFGAPPAPAPTASPDSEMPDLELDLTFTSESNFYTDVMGTDLGLFIATWVVKPVGTPLVVRLTVPAVAQPFVVSGVVQWVLEFSPSIEAPPGIGLSLKPIHGEARRAIEAFMKVRTPILHDE